MLYLSQRKISQITRTDNGERRDNQQLSPPQPSTDKMQPQTELSSPPPGQPQAPHNQPDAGRRQLLGLQSHQAQQGGNQTYEDSGPEGSATKPQPQTPPNPNELKVSVDPKGEAYLNSEITKTDKKIKENKKSLKSRLMIAAFLGFCSICIGIGTNMKYGPGDMSAFQSLAGQRGKDGTAENLWNSGSTTDPLRGINYGFAIAGFTLPIVGTIFSLIFAAINYNTINKGEKYNKLCRQAISGFSISKTVDEEIHPNNHIKIQKTIDQLSSAPHSIVTPQMAVKLARVYERESKASL